MRNLPLFAVVVTSHTETQKHRNTETPTHIQEVHTTRQQTEICTACIIVLPIRIYIESSRTLLVVLDHITPSTSPYS